MKKYVTVIFFSLFCFSLFSCAGFSSKSQFTKEIVESTESILVVGVIGKKRSYAIRGSEILDECSFTKPINVDQAKIDPFIETLKQYFSKIHISDAIRPKLQDVYTELDKECHPYVQTKGTNLEINISIPTLIGRLIKNKWNKELYHKFAKSIIEQEKLIKRNYDAYFYLSFEIDQRKFTVVANFVDLVGDKGNRFFTSEHSYNMENLNVFKINTAGKNAKKVFQKEIDEWYPKLMEMALLDLQKDLQKAQLVNKAAISIVETDKELGLL